MESFDDMIRRKLAEQPVPDFEEKYWLGAEKLLDENDRKRRRGLMFWVWPLAGLLLVGLGFYIGFSVKNRDSSIVEINKKPSEIINKNQLGQTEINEKIDNAAKGITNENQSNLNETQSQNTSATSAEQSSGLNKKGIGNRAKNSISALENGTKNRTAKADIRTNFKDQNEVVFVGKNVGVLGKNDEKNSPELAVVLDKNMAQTIDNQSIAAINKVLFILDLLETRAGEQPLVYVRKVQKFPFYKAEIPPVLPKKTAENRVRFGLQVSGFSAQKDNLNKRIYGGQAGVFVQKELFKRFEAQLFVDYKLLAGLNNSFNVNNKVDSVNQYRFGLELVSGEAVPVLFHHVVPGINLRYNFYGKQWVEIGFAERIWYGSQIEIDQISKSTFGNTLSEDKLKGYSTKNEGWNKFVPELRLGLASNIGQNLQVSFGYNRQFKPLSKSEDLMPGRYYSKDCFDLKLRYLLY